MGIGADELEEEAEHKEAATSQKNKRYAFVCTLWSTPLPQIFVDQCTFKRRDCTSRDYTRSWTPSPLWRPAVCKDTLLCCRPKHQAHTPHSYAFAYLGSCNCCIPTRYLFFHAVLTLFPYTMERSKRLIKKTCQTAKYFILLTNRTQMI